MRQLTPTALILCCFGLSLSFAKAFAENSTAASDLSADPTLFISNLVFYPHVGRMTIAPQLILPIHDSSSSDQNTSPSSSSDVSFEQITVSLQMGVFVDGLRVSITESELLNRQNTITNASNGNVTATQSSGLSDPSLQLNYRWLHSTHQNWFGDVAIITSPSLGTHQNAAVNLNGNNAKGYGTLGMSASLFWLQSFNEIQLSANLTREFSGNGNGAHIFSSYNRESTWNSSVSIFDRMHLSPLVFINFQLDFQIPYSYTQTNFANAPITTEFAQPFYLVPHLGFGYLASEHCLLESIVTHTAFTSTALSPTGSSNNFSAATSVALRARVEF